MWGRETIEYDEAMTRMTNRFLDTIISSPHLSSLSVQEKVNLAADFAEAAMDKFSNKNWISPVDIKKIIEKRKEGKKEKS